MLGQGVVGAVAPVGVAMVFGAFLFGIGMQVAGACASGTLFTAGGGNTRMFVVLTFFCAGTFWASLDLWWWNALPGFGRVALTDVFGTVPGVALQLALIGALFLGLRRLGTGHGRPLWPPGGPGGMNARALLRGPWPLLLSAGLLALLNWATLVVAGHPWSITWGFTLWGAKAAAALGWDPATSGFWTGGFQEAALARSVFLDTTSVMDFGIMLGALLAAGMAGRFKPTARIGLRPLAAAVAGGLLLGYGARLAYGCNIGAFFSGIASTSLHGWVWIVCAIAGNAVGVRLRPLFHAGG